MVLRFDSLPKLIVAQEEVVLNLVSHIEIFSFFSINHLYQVWSQYSEFLVTYIVSKVVFNRYAIGQMEGREASGPVVDKDHV